MEHSGEGEAVCTTHLVPLLIIIDDFMYQLIINSFDFLSGVPKGVADARVGIGFLG